MKKILFVANIHKHFRAFHIPYIKYLKSEGFEVHVAANDSATLIEEADKQYNLPITRNPFSLSNLRAINQLKKIIAEENYVLIHCHTAMGSVVARLAAKKFKKKGLLKVLYTAHGFHFYKNSPKIYWILYYPMEKYLSKFTDGLITINEEDYKLALNCKFNANKIFKIHGIGLNDAKFKDLSADLRESIRKKNGYSKDCFLIIYIAEFITRKDHQFIIDTIPTLKSHIQNFKFVFAGRGKLIEKIKLMVETEKLHHYVDFVGFRTDIAEFILMADVGVSVSKQEGLPMNVAEEMFTNKPVIATKIRGHVDLIDHGINGFLFERGDNLKFVNYIKQLYSDRELRQSMGEKAKAKVEPYLLSSCLEEMSSIYNMYV